MSLARPVALAGMMASGKSTVGKLLASRLGVPFVDTDELIERSAHRSVADLFATEGESAFRARERRVVADCLADPTPRIIALGGGALLDRALRLDALQRWTVTRLHVSAAVVCERAAGSGRPLLAAAEPRAVVERLMLDRAEAYAECHATIDAERAPDLVAEAVLRAVAAPPLVVALGARTYPIHVGAAKEPLAQTLAKLAPTRVLTVTDENVEPLVPAPLRDLLGGMFHVTPPGELAKTATSLHQGWQRAAELELDRGGLVVGLGGGAVTDLAGFLSGTWMRGVRWVAMPTTLLAMVDAAMGGKTAVDLGSVKNVVGVFHQPSAVLSDPVFCQTESARAFSSGLAEVVKTALVGDAALIETLERHAEAIVRRDPELLVHVIRAAAAVKADIVSRDEREAGLRAVLNLGHTVGHGLEAEGGLSRWTHGEAVGLGTVVALRVGEQLGVTDRGLAERVRALLGRLGLPVDVERSELLAAASFIGRDKKRAGANVKYVLVEGPGRPVIRLMPIAELTDQLGR